MNTTRAIAFNTGVQIIGKVISTLLGLIAIGLLTRYLGQEQFGWYVTVISFLGFAGILIDFGLIPVTAQMLSEPRYSAQKLLPNLLGFRFLTAVIFFGLVPIVALFFPYNQEIKIAIAFTTISFLAISLNQVFIGFYQNQLKMHLPVIGEIISRLILVAGLGIMVLRQAGFFSLLWMVVVSSIGYTLFMWIYARRYGRTTLAFDLKIWKEISQKMWPIAVSIIFNVVYLKGDVILLSLFRSQTEVGLYGAAYRVLDIVSQTAMMIMGVMLPLLAFQWSRQLRAGFQKLYQQSFDIMMLFSLPLVVGTHLLADKIMVFVAGPQFLAAGIPLRILSWAIFWLFLGAVFAHVAVAINRQKQTMWIYISDAVLTLAGYLYFIPRHGYLGAAYMTVFSEAYAGVLLFLVARHYVQTRLRLISLGKIVLASLVMALFLILYPNLALIWQILGGALIYLLVLFSVRGISPQTWQEIFFRSKE
ncbi:MAG TPA: flippase [Patescibacteria group bacterium]|nr:flippase [Patescibacteria group bacterium]